jgi:hypothetical protein
MNYSVILLLGTLVNLSGLPTPATEAGPTTDTLVSGIMC